jgi:hypothetical protein
MEGSTEEIYRINPDGYRDGCAFFVTFFAQAKKVDNKYCRRRHDALIEALLSLR